MRYSDTNPRLKGLEEKVERRLLALEEAMYAENEEQIPLCRTRLEKARKELLDYTSGQYRGIA